jgi:hypothetical protein
MSLTMKPPDCPPGRGDRGEILTDDAFEHALCRSGFADDERRRLASPAIDHFGRFYRKRGQNDGPREDRSSAVSETVDAGIWKS